MSAMASAILGWSKHASRIANLLSSPPPKLFRDIYEGGVLQRGYMTLDSRVIGGYSSNASRARDYSSDGLDVNTNANTMVYGKTYSSEEEKCSSFKVCQDNNAFLTQHNQMYCSCTHCPNCLARVAHNQFPSYCDELLSPPPPEVNCRKSAAEFFRGPKHPVGELTKEMRKKFSKSYEEDCPSATAFHTRHNQVCHSCTHCPNCFAHVAHHQLPSYCCKLPVAPPPEGNSKNDMGHRCRGQSRETEIRKKFSKSYEEDCPSATAFHTRHNQICHSCTHCPNCFAHVAHHQLPSYCCKLPVAPPPEGNSKNDMGHRCRGQSRETEIRFVRRQSDEGIALATKFSELFGNWCETYSSEEEKQVLSIARSRGKGILVEDAEERDRVEAEWNEEIEWNENDEEDLVSEDECFIPEYECFRL